MENTTMIIEQKKPVWFRDWFNSPYYHKLYAHRDDTEAAAFIDALINELQPEANSTMLDLGCGAGRHAKYLAAKGFDVAGTDLSSASIQKASRSQTSRLKFCRHDMRRPFGREQYDYVFNFFTSFGYFDNEADNFRVISNIAAALKPGGKLMMDYINVNPSEAALVASESKCIDGTHFGITRWTDSRFFYKKIRIDDRQPGAPIEFTEQVGKLTLYDFMDMFRLAGLQLQQVYGDYDLGEYNSDDSPRLIMIAQKI